MKNLLNTSLLVCLLTSPTIASAAESTWPGWRGPSRTDVSAETGLMQSWPEGGPKRVWLFKNAGAGYSGPAVVKDKLFILGTRGESEQLLALNAMTGDELWATELGAILNNNWGDGPRSTPTVDGDFVYALSGQGDLVCAKISDGSVVWKVSMSDFGGRRPGWGYCESVLIDGDRLLCTPGGKKGAVVALNKKNGELIWQSGDFQDGAQYASIIAVEHEGKKQYIQLVQKKVVGLAADSGKLLWESSFQGRTAVVSTPVYSKGHVFITAGYGAGCKLVKIGADGSEDVYENKNMKNHHGGVLLLEDHIFGYSDGGGWVCQNFMTGEIAWNSKKLGKGAVSYADGRLYCVEERRGTVVLAEASTTEWKEHGRFVLEPQSEIRSRRGAIWTHPVVVNGKMYLRDQDLIYCYDVKKK